MTVNLGSSYIVPARFATLAKYAKFVVAIAGGLAVLALAVISAYAIAIPTLLSVILYGAVALATALGVAVVPNAQAAEVVGDAKAAVTVGEDALKAVEAKDVSGAVADAERLKKLATSVGQGVEAAGLEVKAVDPTLTKLPVIPPVPPIVPEVPKPPTAQ